MSSTVRQPVGTCQQFLVKSFRGFRIWQSGRLDVRTIRGSAVVGVSEAAALHEPVQRLLRQPAERHRHGVHGSVARQNHPCLCWQGRRDKLLDVLRCVRGGGVVRTRFYGGFGLLALALWNYAPPVGATASYTV